MSILKVFALSLFLFLYAHTQAQDLSAFGGVGVSYDGFFADKAIMKHNKKWPFALGPQAVIGLKFEPAGQSFDALLEISTGVSRIELKIPGSEGRLGIEQLQTMITAGSGLHLQMNEGNVLMPYIMLGASYSVGWGSYSENGDQNFLADIDDVNGQRWDPVVGAGLDWQFRFITQASFNLRFIYTPLNVFEEPLRYSYGVPGGYGEGSIQGKTLQCVFTFRVYLPVKKWRSGDN